MYMHANIKKCIKYVKASLSNFALIYFRQKEKSSFYSHVSQWVRQSPGQGRLENVCPFRLITFIISFPVETMPFVYIYADATSSFVNLTCSFNQDIRTTTTNDKCSFSTIWSLWWDNYEELYFYILFYGWKVSDNFPDSDLKMET